MIRHIVLFKIRDNVAGRSKAENMKLVKKELEALKGQIPQIKKLEVGIGYAPTSDFVWDMVLHTEFASKADLETYVKHPAHVKFGEFFAPMREARALVDYEF